MGCGTAGHNNEGPLPAIVPKAESAAEKSLEKKELPKPVVAPVPDHAAKEESKPASQPAKVEKVFTDQAGIYGCSPEEAKAIGEQIAQAKMKEAREKGRSNDPTYNVTVHPHALVVVNRDNGWACDGMSVPGGCISGITGFYQTSGMKHYSCNYCNYDLCEKCIQKYLVK